MTGKRLQIIHLGNPYDFVVKDHQTNRTYGTFQGDSISLKECLDSLVDENEQLKQFQEQVASVIESKMADNVCNDYKMEVLKEIWDELNLDEVWFE